METLDGIIADPSGFLSSSAPLPEDHPLVDTAGQLESQDNLEEIQDAEELLQIITLDEELVLGE